MDSPVRDMPAFELALMRRGVDELAAGCERCARCRRTPLIGERVYAYEAGLLLCELCRAVEPKTPVESRLVHGPEFGHTLRSAGQRAAA